MKICTPKNILAILVILFFVFNSIYFIRYVFSIDKQVKVRHKKYSEIEFLKSFIDFNNTTFENKDGIHFYYSNSKIEYKKINDSFERPLNNITCNYFYDSIYDIFIDSEGRICNGENYDFNNGTYCCKKNEVINIRGIESISRCDLNISCCNTALFCIFECINLYPKIKSNYIWDICKSTCNNLYLTNTYQMPYCFLKVGNFSLSSIMMINIAKKNESCEENCNSQNMKCYNHILEYYNKCSELKECSDCIKKDYYGPAINITKMGNICYYSSENKISCYYKNSEIQRVCICL